MNSQVAQQFLKIALMTILSSLTTLGYVNHDQASSIASDIYTLVPAILDLGTIFWTVYAHWNMKKVPVNSVAIAKEDTQGSVIKGVSVTVPGGLAKVVGALFLCVMLSQFVQADKASAQSITSCSLQSVISKLTSQNFIAVLKTCNPKDAQAALDDATAMNDAVAIACLSQVVPIINSVANLQVGILLPFQKFRDAKRANFLSICKSYVDTTLGVSL